MNHRGFTLMEVMISLAVVGVIALAIWAATSQTAKARDIVETTQDIHHQVRVAFDMINRDISSTFLSDHRAPLEVAHDTIFVGTDGGREDSLDFAAFSHNRRFFDADESDQAEISYYLANDPEDRDVVNLVRRASPVLDEKPTEGGQTLILVRNVSAFDLQFYDIENKEWKDEWDTTNFTGEGSKLPTQVRIRLSVNERVGPGRLNRRDNEYREVAYGTQMPVPMRTPLLLPFWIPGMPLGVNE